MTCENKYIIDSAEANFFFGNNKDANNKIDLKITPQIEHFLEEGNGYLIYRPSNINNKQITPGNLAKLFLKLNFSNEIISPSKLFTYGCSVNFDANLQSELKSGYFLIGRKLISDKKKLLYFQQEEQLSSDVKRLSGYLNLKLEPEIDDKGNPRKLCQSGTNEKNKNIWVRNYRHSMLEFAVDFLLILGLRKKYYLKDNFVWTRDYFGDDEFGMIGYFSDRCLLGTGKPDANLNIENDLGATFSIPYKI